MRDWKKFREPIVYGKSEMIYEESDLAVLFVGHMAELAEAVRSGLKEKGYSCSLVNARFCVNHWMPECAGASRPKSIAL